MAFPRRSTNQNAIGSPVIDGTAGSVLFVGTGPVLAQDNADLFWDDTNNLLKIKSGVAGKAALNVGVAVDGGGYAEIASLNDMQVLGTGLVVTATDNGGAASTSFSGMAAVAEPTHTSGVLSHVEGIRATVLNSGNGGTVTTATALNAQVLSATGVTTAIGINVDNVAGATNNFALKTGTGVVGLGDALLLKSVVIGSLPASPALGMVMVVTDALTPVAGATVGAGGSAKALVWYNGADWTVVGV